MHKVTKTSKEIKNFIPVEESPQENAVSLMTVPPGFDTTDYLLTSSPPVVHRETDNAIQEEEKAGLMEEEVEEEVGGDRDGPMIGSFITSHETPHIVTSSDETADTVSTSSVGNAELTTTDDLQFNIKALIDFIVSR